MNVDIHNHAFPESVIDLVTAEPAYGIEASKLGVKGGRLTNHELFASLYDPAAKIAELDSRGVDAAVLSIAPRLLAYHVDAGLGEQMCDATNSGLAAMCASEPERLHWMAHVPLRAPERAAVLLEQAKSAGAVGVEIGTSIASTPLDEAGLDPFWAAAERLGMPVFVHPAYNADIAALKRYYLGNAIGNPLETTICAERLVCSGILDRHRQLRVVLSHGGGFFPFLAGRLKHARTVRPELADSPEDPWLYAGQLIFDTITHDVQALTYMISRVGAENVVLGSDFPYDMSTPRPMDQLREAVDEATATVIAQDNPRRLFGI
jgi:aminocarboxymuconate-semialdehyde decarboxylase